MLYVAVLFRRRCFVPRSFFALYLSLLRSLSLSLSIQEEFQTQGNKFSVLHSNWCHFSTLFITISLAFRCSRIGAHCAFIFLRAIGGIFIYICFTIFLILFCFILITTNFFGRNDVFFFNTGSRDATKRALNNVAMFTHTLEKKNSRSLKEFARWCRVSFETVKLPIYRLNHRRRTKKKGNKITHTRGSVGKFVVGFSTHARCAAHWVNIFSDT